MKRTPLILASLTLVSATSAAQPAQVAQMARPGLDVRFGGSPVQASADGTGIALPGIAGAFGAPRIDVASSTGSRRLVIARESASIRLDLETSPAGAFGSSSSVANGAKLWVARYAAPKRRNGDIDWLGLLSEQVQIDAVMHMWRLGEPKTHREVYHRPYADYLRGLKGYFTTGARWHDGDPFFTNDINHPLMGAVYSHVYSNHDRRCQDVRFGDRSYWGCLGRATAYAVAASINWEWNPVMSETALGHVGKFYTCADGRCSGEGGWTDLVMTPFGGMGIRLAGDVARAKLWPVLDRHLSGNAAARVLKVAVKIMTDPARLANCAFNLNFTNALSSGRPAVIRQAR